MSLTLPELMDAPVLPSWSEPERIAALQRYDILDTPPEPEFDDIAQVAALVLKAPIALVNIIANDRQFFKAHVGVGDRETPPLDASFCGQAILQPGLTIVPDALEDPRFANSPIVTGDPHLRFYAGALLETPEGLPIGTVCVLDVEPRPEGITEEQKQILLALARQAMTQLELRRALEMSDLLAKELSHRIQNVFTVLNGLVTLSARGRDEGVRTFANELCERVHALARANEFVRPSALGNTRQTLHALLAALVKPYEVPNRRRVTIEGDDARLGSASATALALVVHELATNAVKYGALQGEGGEVVIDTRRSLELLTLVWREQGGPAIAGIPERQGFGSLITGRSVTRQLAGDIDFDWAPTGLVVRLSLPLEQLAR